MTIAPWVAAQSIPLNSQKLKSIAISDDGKSLVTADRDGIGTLIETDTLSVLKRAFICTSRIRWLGFVQQRIVAVELNRISLFNHELQIQQQYEHPRDITAFCLDHTIIFISDTRGQITQLDRNLGFLQMALTRYKITSLLATVDHLWVGTNNGYVRKLLKSPIYHLQSYKILGKEAIHSIATIPRGFVVISDDQKITVWNHKKESAICTYSYTVESKHLLPICFKDLVGGHRKLPISYKPLKDPDHILPHNEAEVNVVAFSPCRHKLYSAVRDQLVCWKRDVQNLRMST